MATITGTNGDDNLVGTSGADTINSKLGHDTVDGAGGVDTLTIDYSVSPVGNAATFSVVPIGGTYYGSASVYGSSSYVNFYNIEQLSLKGMTGNDSFDITESPTVTSGAFTVDGSTGFDYLSLDVSAFSGSTFSVASNGAITSNRGTFSGLEQFNIRLGGGANSVTTTGANDTVYGGVGTNTINTGAGQDYIYSSGADTVDGGADYDVWTGNYSGSSSNLTFTFGATGAGTLSNGTTLKGIEQVSLTTGSGNDTFNVGSSATSYITAGVGTDTLNVTGGGTTGYTARVSTDGSGAARVSCNNSFASGIEKVNAAGSDVDDSFYVDGSVLSNGVQLNLNGGSGNDYLNADFSSRSNTTFSVASDGAITTNSGTYSNFEQFYIRLGGGANSVTTAGASDTVYGGVGTNTINTGAGNDYVYGSTGTSTINTGAGDDYVYNGLGTDTVDGGAGTDYFMTTGYSGGYTITQDGSGGYFIKDIDSSDGNYGTDHLTNVEYVSFYDKTVNLPVYGGGSGVTITGTSGNDVISDTVTVPGQPFATAYADTLKGLAGDDKLYGMAGDDLLWGGAGNDLLDGGSGNDTATYSDATSAVKVSLAVATAQSTGGAGSDTLASIENLIGSAFNDTLTGDSGANRLEGGLGNDILNGGADADTMVGGAGNDTYYVDNAGDVVTELLNEGTDLVSSSVTFTLSDNVENLTLTGSANINGIGNGLANVITGNSGNNTLYGNAGNDILKGGLGNDTLYGGADNDKLDGGAGVDAMYGGTGNDSYTVDNVGDTVIEYAGEGTDLVSSSVTFTLSDNVENLTLTGSANINGTGNGLANVITGNAGNNVLIGGIGNDKLSGLAGNDTLDGGDGLDTLLGGDGNDLIFGGKGNDTLTGGAGIDTFNFLKAADNGLDKITDFVSGTDKLSFTGADYGFAAGHVLTSAEFQVGTGPVGTKAQFVFNATTHTLYFDADGSNPGAAVSLATLGTLTTIAATDIQFV